MKAEELRIGNFIIVSNPSSPIYLSKKPTVEICNYHHISDICKGDEEWVYEPIPLTEQWLIDFGFEHTWLFKHKDTYFSLFDVEGGYVYTADDNYYTSIKIEYVHQLQNLHFAITGRELEKK